MLLVKNTNTKSVIFWATLNVNSIENVLEDRRFSNYWIILQVGASGLLHMPLKFIPCDCVPGLLT